MSNFNSHALKLFAASDAHYLNLRDGANTVSGFGGGQAIHEMLYTDTATGTQNQPIMVRGLHCDIGGQTTSVGYKLGDLQSQVTAEVARASAAEGVVAGNLATEISRASAVETSIAGDLATEIARAVAAELVLTNSIADSTTAVDAEVIRAEAAEAVLTAADTALSARITYLENVIATLLQ